MRQLMQQLQVHQQQQDARMGQLQTELAASAQREAQFQAQVAQQGHVQLPMDALAELTSVLRAATGERRVDTHLVDTKGIGKPVVFYDDETKVPSWSRKFENLAINIFGESFREVLSWAAEQEDSITWSLSTASIPQIA